MKHLISYNEAAIDFLKPKSEEQIKKSLELLTPIDRIKKGVHFNSLSAVKSGVENLPKRNYAFRDILGYAGRRGYYDIVKYLIDNVKIKVEDINDAIHGIRIYSVEEEVSKEMKRSIIKVLEDKKTEILSGIKDYDKLLKFGCESGNYDMVKKAIDNGAIIPKDKYNEIDSQHLISIATSSKNIDIVKLLIDKGIGVNTPNVGPSPISTAIENNSIEMTKLLLDNGADINWYGIKNDLFKWIYEDNHIEILRYLMTVDSRILDKIKEEIGKENEKLEKLKKFI